jgi:hypothetical protein
MGAKGPAARGRKRGPSPAHWGVGECAGRASHYKFPGIRLSAQTIYSLRLV